MFFLRLLFLVLCAAPLSVSAEPLGVAVEAALNYHPSVEAALANRDALREERNEELAAFYPDLDVRTATGRLFGDNSTSRGLSVTRGSGYSYLWEGGVTLTQMLYDGKETMNRVEAADARRESANYNIADVRESLSLRTVVTYLDVVRSREIIADIVEHSKVIEDYVERIGAMVEQGGADESMFVQARDVKAQLDNTLASVEGQLRASHADYAEITGHFPDDPMPRPVPRLDIIVDDVSDSVQYALDHHPMLRSIALTEEASTFDVQAEKSNFYPDFNGEVSYLKRDQKDVIGGEVVDAKALVRMNWHYSLAGAQKSRVNKTLHRASESRAQGLEKQKRVEREIRVAYNERNTAQRQLEILSERRDINRDLFKTYEVQFEGARANLLQLMQSENALFNAELSVVNGEFRVMAAQFAILASTGRLQEALSVVPAAGHGN